MDETAKRILEQAFMDATRRDQYKQCLVNDGCPNDTVKGHSVPESYMKRLPGYPSQMRVFNRSRFGRLPRELPMTEGVGDASTGYFTCEVHEDLFGPADNIVDVDQMPNVRTLNLMCYRNVLYTRWWLELWARAAERVDDDHNKPIQREIAPVMRAHSQTFLTAQENLERCVLDREHHPCTRQRCGFFEHLVFVSETPPVLAGAQFGVSEYFPNQLGQWGMTLVPGTDSNAMILNFPAEAGTSAMDLAFPGLQKGRRELSGAEISGALLKFFPNIIFSDASWSELSHGEQTNVKLAMAPWEEEPTLDVDLFKGPLWKRL